MANVGYSIFGRPEGQVNIVNGLFQEAKLGGAMYLDGLTDGISLNNSESIAVIRQVTDDAGKSNGITIVSLFDYAESFGSTNRPGGFVGSAVCFKDFPHPSMIQKGLFSLQSAANKLVDSQSRKFLHADNSTWGINLPAHNDAWSISVAGINQPSDKNKSRLVVSLDVPIRDQMLSVVQGVLSNSIYNAYETVLVAQKGDFVDRAKSKGYKIISLFELLDYQVLHNGLNKKFNDTKAKATEQINAYSKKLDEVKTTLQALEQKIKQADERHDNIMGRLQQSEAAFKTSKATAENEGNRLAQVQRDLSEANNHVKQGFEHILKQNKSFRSAFENRISEERSQATRLTENKYSGKIKIDNKGWKPWFINSKFVLIFSVLLLLIGFSISYFFFNKSIDQVSIESNVQTLKKKVSNNDSDNNKEFEIIDEDIQFVVDNRKHFKLNKRISSAKADSGLKKLATEILIILDRDSAITKKEDSIKVQNYKNCTYYLLPLEKDAIEKTVSYDFETDKRKDILEKYLEMDGNIYSTLGFTIKDSEYLMEHFIWMVGKLSDYEDEKDRDLIKTNKKVHIIPLIKSE